MPRGAVRPTGPPLSSRLGVFATAASLPIALQLLYVVCIPFAGRLGSGSVTSFGYAYLAAASLVSVTAVSLGLVTSVPLARSGLSPALAARHVVSASWIALAFIGAAAGVFALAGADLVEAVLGGAYGGRRRRRGRQARRGVRSLDGRVRGRERRVPARVRRRAICGRCR